MLYPILMVDHPDWHRHRDYSPQVRNVLRSVFLILDRAKRSRNGFVRAYRQIRPFLDAPMSPHQRLRILYLTAHAREALGEYAAALHWMDEILNLDSRLRDTADLAQIYIERGSMHRRFDRLALAADNYRQALHLLDTPQRHQFHDSTFRLNVLSSLASFEFHRARPWEATHYLKLADGLQLPALQDSLALGAREWVHVLVDRWNDNPDKALRHAHRATDIFTRLGPANSAGRITLQIADCLLDKAAILDRTSTERHRLLKEAQAYVRRAADLARKGEDEIGAELVALTAVRLERLGGDDTGRMAELERLLRWGRERGDLVLWASALTMLGDELRVRELPHAALDVYRQVWHLLRGSDVMATGVWAARAARALEQE